MVSFRRFNPASAGDFDDHMLDLSAPNGVVRPLTVDKDTTTKQRFSKAKRFLVKSKLGCAVLNILCILVILFGHGVSIGPGIYAIFIHKPEIVIDKSIQAFNIPSHQAIKHQDALELAIADSKKIHKRGKRSIEQRDEVNEKADFHHQLKRALTKDFQNETLSSSAGPDIRSEKFLSDNIFGNIKEGVDVMESYGSYDNGVFGLENGNDVHSSNELPSSDRRASNDIFANKLHQFKPSDTRDNEPKQEMSESDYNDDVVNMQELLHVQEPLMNADAWYKSQRELTKRRSKRSTNRYDNTFRQDPQSLLYWRITLVYLAKGEDQNIFTPERLKRIHEIETMITRHPNYTNFCYKNRGLASRNKNVQNMIDGCAPINSLMTYFFPSYSDGELKYDGLGTTLQDVNKTLLLAMNKETFFWYVDEKVTSSHLKSRLLRSEIHFGSPLKGFHNYRDRRRDQSHKFVEFAKSFVDMLSKASDSSMTVLYGGNELYDYQVDTAFWNDIKLSIFAGAFIVFFMFILTSFSLWLTFWGITSIACSFPLAIFFYRVVCQNNLIGILNGAAAFLIIGIGVDDVFVFINTFRQAEHIENVLDRMKHTILTAGIATFFTSFTTAAAFAANIASAIPAIHGFGLFMCLIVSCCWLTVMIIMPPAILMWHQCFAVCESCCYTLFRCKCCVPSCNLELPRDISTFLENPDCSAPYRQDDKQDDRARVSLLPRSEANMQDDESNDGDVPLLQMEQVQHIEGEITESMNGQHDNDDPLLVLEQELTAEEDKQRSEGCGLTKFLQVVLYHYVVVPVIKARWAVLVVYIVVLTVSCGLMSQLKPASKPPQLFQENTNLQQLLDLAYNFSESSIKCDFCSGVWKENPTNVVNPPTEPPQSGKWTWPLTTRPRVTPPVPPPPTMRPTQGPTTRTTPAPAQKVSSTFPPFVPPFLEATTRTPGPTNKPTSASVRTNQSPIPAQLTTTKSHIPMSEPPEPTYNPCENGKCDHVKKRPNLETGASVYVVFGIRGVDRSNVSQNEVIKDKGSVVFNPYFMRNMTMGHMTKSVVRDLCRLCKIIANNTDLVKPGSSQCMPDIPVYQYRKIFQTYLQQIEECRNLPGNKYYNYRKLPARAMAGMEQNGNIVAIKWIAFTFESTTYKGQGYLQAYSNYQQWERFIKKLKVTEIPKDSPLQDMYQTSKFWRNVMMEVVAVTSAIYGLVLSLVICVAAVMIFTGHVVLLLIVVLTITGVICLVVSIFYMAGWEMGAVEAVSLSILVGSSVDYCVHLVEGYILAGRSPPADLKDSNRNLRQWRTKAAVSHIGVSIVSSALTTITAAIPLTQTLIRPFAKFGQIVAMNTSIAILYTLTVSAAMLAIFGPARYKRTLKSTLISCAGTGLCIGVGMIILYIIHVSGVNIPSPSGQNLFG